ncbi:MAG TPA: ABC transporter ATP-binding protein [Clostridiales bacterium]|nr:ABC transporter ATP-binding protein [Clostridiales bacterium]
MDSILTCNNLSKSYGFMLALSSVNLAIPKGRVVGLLGPNGSGKTTFIKIAAGLLTPSAGNIFVDSKPVSVDTKRIVSYLPDRTYFSKSIRVKECLELFADFYQDFDMERAMQLLKDHQISTDAKMKQLSKGMQEKVQLALVMSRRAKLYLLDEPIGGVDPAARDYILHTIVANIHPESTILISTHLIADVENILDDVIFLKSGSIVLHDSVDNIRNQRNSSVDALFREVFAYA